MLWFHVVLILINFDPTNLLISEAWPSKNWVQGWGHIFMEELIIITVLLWQGTFSVPQSTFTQNKLVSCSPHHIWQKPDFFSWCWLHHLLRYYRLFFLLFFCHLSACGMSFTGCCLLDNDQNHLMPSKQTCFKRSVSLKFKLYPTKRSTGQLCKNRWAAVLF